MKNKYFLFNLMIIFLLCISASAKEPSWHLKLRQIKPLESSKQEVEKIFDNPEIRRNFEDKGIEFVLYKTSEGKFTVEYSTGKCLSKSKDDNSEPIGNYKVEKGIVIRIIFFPKKEEKLSKFDVKNQLTKTSDGHDPAWHYVNFKLGVDYTVQKGKVIHVKFYPSSDMNNLKCKSISNKILNDLTILKATCFSKPSDISRIGISYSQWRSDEEIEFYLSKSGRNADGNRRANAQTRRGGVAKDGSTAHRIITEVKLTG